MLDLTLVTENACRLKLEREPKPLINLSPPTTAASDRPMRIRETWLTRKPRQGALTLSLGATLVLAAASLAYWLDFNGVAAKMAASGEAVFGRGEYWRLWTTIFTHGDTGHLISNSFLFFVLGYFLYGYFGSRVFPLAALFWGGIANLVVLPTYEPDIKLIGASGVVYWMGGAWLALYYFIARQKARVPRWLRTMGVGLLLFAPQSFEADVSYRVHLAGFLLGLVGGTWHFLRHRKLYRSAEVLEPELTDDDIDPQDDLPPPEGFPPTFH